MKRIATIVAGAALFAFASGAVAGEKKKCTADPADCKAKMKAKIAAKGWLGVELEKKEHKRVVVKKVLPDTPAAAAGFEKGDVFLALDGIDYYTDDEATRKKIEKAWAPGHKATFTVERAGAQKELTVEFGKVPAKVAKEWIDKHMQEHHAEAKQAEADKEG